MESKSLVRLNEIEKVKKFVLDVQDIDADIDLVSGRYVIDAKSIMGIFSLDLSKPIEIVINSDNFEDIKRFNRMVESYQ